MDESLERENYEHSNSITHWEECRHLRARVKELEQKIVETPAHWTKIISENKTLKTERDHYMKEMYRLIDEIRKLRGTI
jgi:uncharacterized coiled-coil DUF342 family protein